jgi:hypothetical protein
MGNVSPLENHGFRRKLVEVGLVNFYASATSDHVRSLLIREEDDQVRLFW